MHQALYRKWRPHSFDDVCGQDHITSVLKYELENGKLSHAYLFCGSRGVGKTTCAKILAKAANCEDLKGGEPCGKCASCLSIESGTAVDVLEMDAASNNGVEDIRAIKDEVVFAPSHLKCKVYIIDEVHMLSQSAFNALLKTLEEPPSHVIFILATTEQQKLPATIVSRCQRFEFKRISTEHLSERITLIAKEEGIGVTPGAAHLISRLSQGGMRDAISLLELCAGGNGQITESLVNDVVGSTGRERTVALASAIASKNYNVIFEEISELVQSSKNISVFWQDMISFWRDMLVFKTTPDASKYLDLTDSETAELADIASRFTRETLLWHSRLLDSALPKIKSSAATARMIAELTLLRMSDEKLDDRNDALLSRLSKVEERIASGNVTVTAAPDPAPKKEEIKPKKAVKENDPKAEPTKKAEEPKEVPSPVAEPKSESPKPAAAGRVLRPLRCWVEVLEEISVSDILLYIDLNTSKAFYDENGNTVVVFESEFMLKRADNPETRARVAELIKAQTGKQSKVSFELMPSTEQGDTVIDEILDNMN